MEEAARGWMALVWRLAAAAALLIGEQVEEQARQMSAGMKQPQSR